MVNGDAWLQGQGSAGTPLLVGLAAGDGGEPAKERRAVRPPEVTSDLQEGRIFYHPLKAPSLRWRFLFALHTFTSWTLRQVSACGSQTP